MTLLIALFAGCDADCDNLGRVDGTYAVFHDVLNVGEANAAEGDGAGKAEGGKAVTDNYDEVSYSTLINGWSRWNLKWSPGTGKVTILASDAMERMGDPGQNDGQSFTWTGSMSQREGNCNIFDLSVAGLWSTSLETHHTFTYESELVWTSEGLGGTYTYSDTFTEGDNLDPAGGITKAQGEAFFVAQGEEFDTGF